MFTWASSSSPVRRNSAFYHTTQSGRKCVNSCLMLDSADAIETEYWINLVALIVVSWDVFHRETVILYYSMDRFLPPRRLSVPCLSGVQSATASGGLRQICRALGDNSRLHHSLWKRVRGMYGFYFHWYLLKIHFKQVISLSPWNRSLYALLAFIQLFLWAQKWLGK